jgi:DNA-binding MarR family transcriptional regulator
VRIQPEEAPHAGQPGDQRSPKLAEAVPTPVTLIGGTSESTCPDGLSSAPCSQEQPEISVRRKKDDSQGLVYLLKCTELAVRSCAEVALAPFQLTPALFLTLFRLKESEGVSSADLARAIGVRPQSIVDLIRPLERAGLIRRREAPEHRRILRISLTAAGERLLARAIPVARQLEEELFSNLTAQEIAHLSKGLTKLLSSAQAHDMHPTAARSTATRTTRRRTLAS